MSNHDQLSTEELNDRRKLARARIREGWDRIAAEHGEKIDWTRDNELTQAAEEKLSSVVELFARGEVPLANVKRAFDAWAQSYMLPVDQRNLFV